jgi:hypothetical protein
MSTRNNYSTTTGIAASFAIAMVALLAACSQTHVDSASDAAILKGTANPAEGAATSDLPEIVIVASREEPRTRG